MQMILSYENGHRADAILLAGGFHRMRVVIRGSKDATELRLIKDQWMTEEGDAVDIDAIVTAPSFDAGGAFVHGHAA